MNQLLGSACFVAVSFGAGILGQEVVSRMVAVGDENSVARIAVASRWSDPREYYQHAHLCDSPRWQRASEDSPEVIALPAEPPPAQSPAMILAQRTQDTGLPPEEAVSSAPSAPKIPAAAASLITEDCAADSPSPHDHSPAVPVASLSRDVPRIPTATVVWQGTSPPVVSPAREPSNPADVVGIAPPPAEAIAVPPPVAAGDAIRDRGADSIIERVPARPVPSAYVGAPSHDTYRYLEPAELIRRQAAERAEQRRRRIELRKWLGYSAAHPPAPVTPMMSGEMLPPLVLVVPVVVGDAQANR